MPFPCCCRRPDDAIIEEVANKLISLCVTLNEYPHVRYNQASVVGNAIANLVQQGLNVRLEMILILHAVSSLYCNPMDRVLDSHSFSPYSVNQWIEYLSSASTVYHPPHTSSSSTHPPPLSTATGVCVPQRVVVVLRGPGPHGAGPWQPAHPRPRRRPTHPLPPRPALPGLIGEKGIGDWFAVQKWIRDWFYYGRACLSRPST